MNGISRQYNPKIALTSGFDSRLLLAASVDITDRATYFVDNLGYLKNHHDEIYVPRNLAKKFDLQFSIMDAEKEIPEWFKTILTENITSACVSPVISIVKSIYTRLMRDDTDYVIINGNMTEILRIKERKIEFDPFIQEDGGSANAEALMKFTGYDNPFLRDEIGGWADTIDVSAVDGATVLDMFYWEVHMGNWGALDPAEKETATEQISPFNCRLLMETCLKVPRRRRMTPDYEFFTSVINELWPEVLSEPINPGQRGLGLVKKKIRENMPVSVVRRLRKLMS